MKNRGFERLCCLLELLTKAGTQKRRKRTTPKTPKNSRKPVLVVDGMYHDSLKEKQKDKTLGTHYAQKPKPRFFPLTEPTCKPIPAKKGDSSHA
jgi:hypothetical protein